MYLCHNLNGDATQKIDARRRRGLVVADRVSTVTFSAGGLSSFDICSRRRRHPSQSHACTMARRGPRAREEVRHHYELTSMRRIFQGGAEKEKKKCAAGAMEGENTQTSVDNPFGVQRHVGGTC